MAAKRRLSGVDNSSHFSQSAQTTTILPHENKGIGGILKNFGLMVDYQIDDVRISSPNAMNFAAGT